LIIETQSNNDQDDLEEVVHDPEGDTWEDDFDVDQAVTLGFLLNMHPPSIDDVNRITSCLSVLKCTLNQHNEKW